jgi:hypothetical protein
MEWRRAWYVGSLKQEGWIDVDGAIELRDEGNTKAGDTYCCQCQKIRISPVNSVKRARHFRRHRRPPDETESRSPCTKIRKSQEKGETWKHSQIVDEIKHYLLNDGSEIHFVENVIEAKGIHHDEADLIVKHNKQSSKFSSTEVRILVRIFNWRRQKILLEKFPDSIVIQAQRWQSSEINDLDFGDFVRKNVDEAYQMDAESRFKFYSSSAHKTFIPNIYYWNHDLSKANKQRTVEINSESLDDDSQKELMVIEELLEKVKRHNMWSVSRTGMHRYHLKHLRFEDYSGDNLHPHRTVDAVLSHAENFCEQVMSKNLENKEKTALRWGLKGVGEFWIMPINVMDIASKPAGLWEWDKLTKNQKKKCLTKVKKLYYDEIYHEFPDGSKKPIVKAPLVNVSFEGHPQVLGDENSIQEFVSNWEPDTEEELGPLSREEFEELKFYISADKWMNGLSPRHPIYESLLHQRLHSTSIYDHNSVIWIPYSINEELINHFGREPTETELKDLLEKGMAQLK